MGCMKLNKQAHKGIIVQMSKQDNNGKNHANKNSRPNKSNDDVSINETSHNKNHSFNINTVCNVGVFVLTFLGAVGGMFVYLQTQFTNLNEKIEKCITEDDIKEMRDDVSEMHDYLYNVDGVKDQLDDFSSEIDKINSLLDMPAINASSDMAFSLVDLSVEYNDKNIVTSSLTPNTYVGTDANGNLYIAEDLINETILLTYTSNDNKEVYFLGQYNEDYHWDGYCVTNAYNLDGSLYGICESNFDDGKRLDYLSFVQADKNEWIYSNKICKDDINSGTNKTYMLNYGKTKNFTETNVRITDIVYVNRFIENNNPKIIRYYNGNTSDGKYNDDTGNAFVIIYDNDGTIKTFYAGNFKDGKFDDYTGNAWEIAYSDKSDCYYYNSGRFENSSAVKKSSDPINNEEINKMIYDFQQKKSLEIDPELLKWK